MVSDKPPRRSRSGKTPVTIDLAAEDAKPVAEPVRSNDTDVPGDTPSARPIEKSLADDAPSATDKPAAEKTAADPASVNPTPKAEEPDFAAQDAIESGTSEGVAPAQAASTTSDARLADAGKASSSAATSGETTSGESAEPAATQGLKTASSPAKPLPSSDSSATTARNIADKRPAEGAVPPAASISSQTTAKDANSKDVMSEDAVSKDTASKDTASKDATSKDGLATATVANAAANRDTSASDMRSAGTPSADQVKDPVKDRWTASDGLKSTTAAPPVRPSDSGAGRTSALVASGIIGGFVALLLAGSMQYAGYIPGLNQQPSAATSAELDDLRQQIAGLQSPVQNAGVQDPAIEERLKALEAGAGNSTGEDALRQQLQALQTELDSLKSAAQSQGNRDDELGQRLGALESKVNEPGRDEAVAQALAAAALKAATERGGSFAAELQTYGDVAPDDPALGELQPYAEQGVPTRAQLSQRLPAVSNAVLAALHQPEGDQSVTDRLFSSAMRMVKVRPVGEAEGDTPEAVLARMEERVKNGDLPAALAEWNRLPDPAKQASADFQKALTARIAVEELMNSTLTRAMAGADTNG
ncbi:hypothetical protein [Rhizobium sp. SSA_523]|uniref:hypothetical protein n=1 Tax=Rhizobium sp. SSA_523 TaxID=2952477 RepID=UPI002091B371|nr:hypothetical protein [Rhizobium sp. SSA_523]MCO5733570.1 hypothetical protein [Rhizobium sp. SSA_523]WKC23130.1 hypothetical protein QTJ18_20205 [Rhizobium sp. SSA_523]